MWREFIGLALSCIFFVASYFTPDVTQKMILILIGAIIGETIMVLLGTFKMRKFFRGHPSTNL